MLTEHDGVKVRSGRRLASELLPEMAAVIISCSWRVKEMTAGLGREATVNTSTVGEAPPARRSAGSSACFCHAMGQLSVGSLTERRQFADLRCLRRRATATRRLSEKWLQFLPACPEDRITERVAPDETKNPFEDAACSALLRQHLRAHDVS